MLDGGGFPLYTPVQRVPHPTHRSVSNHAFLNSAQEMIKQFYEKLLPKHGVYCLGELNRSLPKGQQMRHHYAGTIDELLNKAEGINARKHDAYVTPGTFQSYKRSASNSSHYKSLFIDFDVSVEKAAKRDAYASKDDAIAALDKFLEDAGLPPPVRISSGIGIHAYWIFDQDIPAAEFLPYAKAFKTFCKDHLEIFDEEAAPADLARFMRFVGSTNYRAVPPAPCEFITTDFGEYSWDEFKTFLGEPEPESADAVLARVTKGLSDDDRKMLGMDNFKHSFEKIAVRSIEGDGCAQILDALTNPNTISRTTWAGVLTVAVRCDDGEEAIHKISEDYDGYSPEETHKVAHSFSGCRRCDWFEANSDKPNLCKGCRHKGHISSPIQLGKELRVARAPDKEDSVWQVQNTQAVHHIPQELFPFIRGANGGIYFQPTPTVDKKGVKHQDDDILILQHDFYPTRRVFSAFDGDCMMMRLDLPHDTVREFLLPMKIINSADELKKFVAHHGVICEAFNAPRLSSYITKWAHYMINTFRADQMRMQMGWTDDRQAFVLGNKEMTDKGELIDAPASPYARNIARFINGQGDYNVWKESVQYLAAPEFESHAFAFLTGFGSPLMRFTSTAGVTLSLLGGAGCGKTGSMYAAMSIYGDPKALSVFDATPNGMIGRFLTLHNLPLCIDETSNTDAKILAHLVHGISHGKAKIRMQASANAEREYEASASLIGILTGNQSIYNKLEILKGSPDGEAARLVELLVKKPKALLGLTGGTMGKTIFNPLNFNFGHAGIEYSKELFRLGEGKIYDAVNHWGDRFKRDFGDDSTYRFYENMVAATMGGGQIAHDAGIITFDLDRVYREIVMEMIMIRDDVMKINRSDYNAVLGDFINKFIANTLAIRDGKVAMEPRGALMARMDNESNTYQVSKTEMKKYLAERQISTREFEFGLKQNGTLLETKKGRLTTGWKTGVAADPVNLYIFKSQIAEELVSKHLPQNDA